MAGIREHKTDLRQKMRQESIEDLQDEYEILDRIDEDYERKLSHRRRRIVITVAIIALLLAAVLIVMIFQTYDSVQVLRNHDLSDAGNNGYESFAGDILKYNCDGVSLMNANGEDKWNQAVQIQQPAAVVNGDYAVVADVTGTDVYIFDEKGLCGQASCSKPIEKASVSAGGIATVIQENGATPVVSCFNDAGELLLEHQASLNETGYPIATAVSDDGEVLAVSYMKISQQGVGGQVIYYDLKTKDKDKKLFTKETDQEAVGEIWFMGDTSVVIGETGCLVYKGIKKPELKKELSFEGEIEKVFHDDRYFGFVTREQSGSRKLTVCGRSGSVKLEKTMPGSFEKVSFTDNQIILYSGQTCSIYTLKGIHRFDGQLQDHALFMAPLKGLNRYAVVTNDGITTVHLTK